MQSQAREKFRDLDAKEEEASCFFSEPAMRLAGAIEIFQALTSWLGRELRFFWGI